MKIKLYQVDAFSDKPFEGNPAAICPLNSWIPDSLMQSIAGENNLSETAFFVPGDDGYRIRWFTPTTEVNLCGHATLAAGHVLFEHLGYKGEKIVFDSQSGLLSVEKKEEMLFLDFPVDVYEKQEKESVQDVLEVEILEAYRGRDDLLFIIENEKTLKELLPDMEKIRSLACRCVIVSAPGDERDFVSRVFAPQSGIPEDPVTGSVHTMLIPYWADKLGKDTLSARQLSQRGGNLSCELDGTRVKIGGQAVTFMLGEICLNENKI